MIRAIFFDFNGVVVDDEPLHLKLFQEVLQEKDIVLSREDYYANYLGLDDHDCMAAVGRDQGKNLGEQEIRDLSDKKNHRYQQEIKKGPPFVPGAREIIKELSQTHYLAIVSGALRNEIEQVLAVGGMRGDFSVIVAAEEVEHGKPAAEGYVRGLDLLNRDFVASSERLLPKECLVVEDSSWGIQAAQGAQMPCVALTTSYPESALPGALLYFKDFKNLGAEQFLQQVSGKLRADS